MYMYMRVYVAFMYVCNMHLYRHVYIHVLLCICMYMGT